MKIGILILRGRATLAVPLTPDDIYEGVHFVFIHTYCVYSKENEINLVG